MIETLADMRNQKKKQNQLIPIDSSANYFQINGKKISNRKWYKNKKCYL